MGNAIDCAPRCLVELERRYGEHLTLHDATELCAPTVEQGTRPLWLVNAMQALGYPRARIRKNLSWQAMWRLLAHNHVLVSWWKPKTDGHWSIVQQMTDTDIMLYDPDDGPRMFERGAFEYMWRDEEVLDSGRTRPFERSAVVAGLK